MRLNLLKWTNVLLVLALVVAGFATFVAPPVAFAGTDTLQLDVVPLDSRLECDRIFFQSSKRVEGTIYVMPRVAVGVSPEGYQLFDIQQGDDGGYLLSIGLYFPRDDETLVQQRQNDNPTMGRCNFDEVKYYLNRDISDPAQQVKTIARMVVTSIEVNVPGIAKPALIGRSLEGGQDVDVLNYQGANYTIELPMSETEAAGIRRRIQRSQGLAIKVRFSFQARSHKGSVEAEVDMTQVAASVSAAVKGQVQVTKGELKAALGASMNSSNVHIVTESAGTDAFNTMAAEIVKQILKDMVPAELPAAPGAEAKDTSDSAPVSVAVAMQLLTKQSKRTFSYQEFGQAESATAETVVNFQGTIRDPNVREVRVISGEADPVLADEIKAGQTLKLTPAYWFNEQVEYKEKVSYLAKEQIESMNLMQYFPDIASEQMTLTNIDMKGQVAALGQKTAIDLMFVKIPTVIRYFWLRTERYPYWRATTQSNRFVGNVNELTSLPIFATFSQLGRKLFHLTELLGDHPAWTGKFDENGTIVITAKQDLGLISLRESFREGVDFTTGPVVLDEVTEEVRDPAFGTSRPQTAVLKESQRANLTRKTVVFNVNTPGVGKSTEKGTEEAMPASKPLAPAEQP